MKKEKEKKESDEFGVAMNFVFHIVYLNYKFIEFNFH